MINLYNKKKSTWVFSTSEKDLFSAFLHFWDLRCHLRSLVPDQKNDECIWFLQQNLQRSLDSFWKIFAVLWKYYDRFIILLYFMNFSQTDEESLESSSLFWSAIAYEVSFHHVKNISAFSESSRGYSTCCLSGDWERLVEALLTVLITRSFEDVYMLDSAVSLSSSSDVHDVEKRFEKLIDNCSLIY